MSIITPVFSPSFIDESSWKAKVPSVDQNKTITLIYPEKASKRDPIPGVIQASKRFTEVMKKLEDENSPEYRSLKRFVKTGKAIDDLTRSAARLDVRFNAYNERYNLFIRCILNVAYFVINLLRGCFGYEKIEHECERIDLYQFKVLLYKLYDTHINEGYTIEILEDPEPASLTNENIRLLELREIPSLKFEVGSEQFVLVYHQESNQFSIELSNYFHSKSIPMEELPSKRLGTPKQNHVLSVAAVPSKADPKNVKYVATQVLLNPKSFYKIETGNATLTFSLDNKRPYKYESCIPIEKP